MAKKKTEYELPKKHPRTERPDRRFDTTQLKESGTQAKGCHRDYAAHWFRWGFAINFIGKKGKRSLEIGCGQDIPLIKSLCWKMGFQPDIHVACDLNEIPPKKRYDLPWAAYHDRFNFVDDWKKLAKQYGKESFDIITCFEVIEHMRKPDGKELLKGLRSLMAPTGTALVSTPVYNGKHMAANHLHEYRFDELREFFEENGLRVESVHGTFMTSQSMKRVMTDQERELVERLHQWYSWDVLANFLAPKYPEASSNCCWVLKRK